MMNRVDLEGLKPGDEVVAKLRFVRLDAEGAWFEMPHGKEVTVLGWHWDCLSLPEGKPKYDPCRLFKKGDIVRVVKRGERGDQTIKEGEIATMAENETGRSIFLRIERKSGQRALIAWPYLELVTPVEELGPYVVRLDTSDGIEEWIVEPRNNNLAFVAVYGDSHPHAKEAAEAERDRLNAEWRKEDKQ